MYFYLRPHKRNIHEDFVRGLCLLPDYGSTLDVAKSGIVLRKETVDEVDSAATKLFAEAIDLEFNLKSKNVNRLISYL